MMRNEVEEEDFFEFEIFSKNQYIYGTNSTVTSPANSDDSFKNFYSFNWRSVAAGSSFDEEEDKQLIGHLIFPPMNSLNFVTKEMLLLRNDLNIPPEQRKTVILSAAEDPSTLIGWQIEIDEGKYAGLHIVTNVKKTQLLRRTLFEINCGGDHQCAEWVQLQRGPVRKKGIKFRPLRPICLPLVHSHHHHNSSFYKHHPN